MLRIWKNNTKRIVSVLIIILLLGAFFCFSSCTLSGTVEVTCDEIAQAYTDAGFYVNHYHKEEDDGSYCHLTIWEEEHLVEGVDEISFYFFESEDDAKSHAKEYEWNVAVYIYAAACGEPRWLKSKIYGDISYQYFGNQMVKPFNDLVKSKS